MNDTSNGNGALIGFLFGAVCGAAVALLMAPATGEETRRRIGATAGKLANNTKSGISKVRNRLGEIGQNLRENAEDTAEDFRQGSESYRQGTESYRQTNP